MLPAIFSLTRKFTLPVIFSMGVHTLLIVALYCFSPTRLLIKPVMTGMDAAVMMVDMATFAIVSPQPLSQVSSDAERSEKPPAPPVSEQKMPASLAMKPVKAQPERTQRERREVVRSTVKKTANDENTLADKKMGSSTGLLPQSEKTSHAPVTALSPAAALQGAGTREPRALVKVKPDYPQRALALHIEGWVKVQYDINEAGRVINIRVLDARPRNLFEREVRQAMKKWRFEAVAASDYVTTVVFKMEGDTQWHE